MQKKELTNVSFCVLIITMKLIEKNLEIRKGYYQNIVPTTRKQNLAAAKCCEDFDKACVLFRNLQYSNDMGTGGPDFEELEDHFKHENETS